MNNLIIRDAVVTEARNDLIDAVIGDGIQLRRHAMPLVDRYRDAVVTALRKLIIAECVAKLRAEAERHGRNDPYYADAADFLEGK